MSKINEYFIPLYTSKKRYFLLTGGRGSLKSTTVHDFIARLTFQVGGELVFLDEKDMPLHITLSQLDFSLEVGKTYDLELEY